MSVHDGHRLRLKERFLRDGLDGFTDIQALELLTHRPGQDYFEYVRAIRADPLAMRVKLADLDHNSDFTRSEGLVPEARLEHWRRKYQTARRILLEESEG